MDIVTFAVGKSSVAVFASCHSAVGISLFLRERSFDPVWMMICSTPTNFPLVRCAMAFSVVGLQSFRHVILMCFQLELQRNKISLCVDMLILLSGWLSAEMCV